jgi:pyrroline-5-carboxylate reductase
MPLKNKKIGIIGSGNMGEALIGGLIHSRSSSADDVMCSDVRKEKLKKIREEYGIRTTTSNVEVIRHAEIIIYAVKPQIIASIFKETAPYLDMSKLVISIAAGVSLSFIENAFKKEVRVIRVMPNIAAFVREAATAIASGKLANDNDIRIAQSIFNSVGKTVVVEEDLMDAVTGLSGSGPAFVFSFIEALVEGGVYMGLSHDTALSLAVQTVYGAAKMALATKQHPAVLRDKVTSPGGTSSHGLAEMEKHGFKFTIIRAVEQATMRSKELGKRK